MARPAVGEIHSIVDRLVDAVGLANQRSSTAFAMNLLERDLREDLGLAVVASGCSLLADLKRLDDVFGYADVVPLLKKHVPRARYRELEAGSAVNSSELAVWRKLKAAQVLTDNPDFDAFPMWGVWLVRHTDGRKAFVAYLVKGYGWDVMSGRVVGAAKTKASAIEALKAVGYISVKDFRARCGTPAAPRPRGGGRWVTVTAWA